MRFWGIQLMMHFVLHELVSCLKPATQAIWPDIKRMKSPVMPHCSHLISFFITGRHIPATEALKLGLVDEVVEENTVEAGIRLANKLIGKKRTVAMPRNNCWGRRESEQSPLVCSICSIHWVLASIWNRISCRIFMLSKRGKIQMLESCRNSNENSEKNRNKESLCLIIYPNLHTPLGYCTQLIWGNMSSSHV